MLISYRLVFCLAYILLMANTLSGCVLDQTYSKPDHEALSLKSDNLVRAAGNLIDLLLDGHLR